MAAKTASTSKREEARKLRLVVAASASGTAFEWYDFFIFGALAPIIARQFFTGVNETAAFIFALLVFAAGFAVRPLGALIFGRIGDRVGRKNAFLVTITLMGVATFAIGLLPVYADIGINAPIALIALRMAQGLAVGGEYGGAAIYVAEHSPPRKRGYQTSWVQTSAIIGLVAALGFILLSRMALGEQAFEDWGWRIPFLLSAGLFALSLYIRLKLEESPLFRKLKEEGTASKAPLKESFLRRDNLRIVLLVLFGLMAAQGVVWYTGYFYTQFFLERVLKVEPAAVNVVMIAAAAASGILYVFFGWLSDFIGRKSVMLAGMGLATVFFFPLFHDLTEAANPALAQAQARAPAAVIADPAECSVQFDPVGKAQFLSSCDIAKGALAASGVSYANETAPPGALAQIRIGTALVASLDGRALDAAGLKAARAEFDARLKAALRAAGYPEKADPARFDFLRVISILLLFMTFATMLYGPLAAALVELFPTRIRYTALSLPYHIGTGWFGGFLPATSFAMVAATGDIYFGLWYPAIVAGVSFFIALIFLPETYRRDIGKI